MISRKSVLLHEAILLWWRMPTMPKARLGSTVWISDVLPDEIPVWLLLWLVSIGVKWLETSERSKKEKTWKLKSCSCLMCFVCFFSLYVKVVAVIHQPRYDTLQLFDDLILLAVGGSVVYAGPTEAVPTGKTFRWDGGMLGMTLGDMWAIYSKSTFNITTPERTMCAWEILNFQIFERTIVEEHCRAVLPIFHSMSCPFVMDLIRPQNPHSLQSCQDAVEHFQTKLHAMLAGLWDGPFDGLAQEILPSKNHKKGPIHQNLHLCRCSKISRTWSQKFQVKFSNNTNPADVL